MTLMSLKTITALKTLKSTSLRPMRKMDLNLNLNPSLARALCPSGRALWIKSMSRYSKVQKKSQANR